MLVIAAGPEANKQPAYIKISFGHNYHSFKTHKEPLPGGDVTNEQKKNRPGRLAMRSNRKS